MHDLSIYFALTFITVLTPGAGVLYTVTSAIEGGLKTAWQAPLGNVLASAAVAVVCAAGLGAILTASPTLFAFVQTCSALVLLYLAWRSWHAPARGFASLEENRKSSKTQKKFSGLTLFISAFLLQLTNPMLYVFQVSMLPQFVDASEPYVEQMTVLIAIFAANGIVIHFGYSYAAAWARRFLASPKASRIINRLSSILFCFFGLSVLAKAMLG